VVKCTRNGARGDVSFFSGIVAISVVAGEVYSEGRM
jgi:hypothetical protein